MINNIKILKFECIPLITIINDLNQIMMCNQTCKPE